MNEQQFSAWEKSVANLARGYPYPPTPDLATAVRQRVSPTAPGILPRRRPPAWAVALAVIVAVLALGVLAVPQTRAAVWSLVIRIGAIRVFVDEAPTAIATATPIAVNASPAPGLSAGSTDTATAVPLALLAAVPGEPIPLADLADFAAFPLRLPPETGEWGPPDSAVVHRAGSRPMVTLIWNDPQRPSQPILALSQTDIPQLAFKMVGADQMTTVQMRDGEGLWIEGPHTLQLPIDGGSSEVRITGNVLVWSDGMMTYRIEGAITQADAIRLAESLEEPAP